MNPYALRLRLDNNLGGRCKMYSKKVLRSKKRHCQSKKRCYQTEFDEKLPKSID